MEARLSEIESLLLATGQADRGAFLELYDKTSAKLFGICLRILKDRSRAEDAMQEVYIKIWHNAGRYQVNGLSPMTWLITVARNHSIDRLRRERRAPEPMEAAYDVADAAAGPEAAAVAADEQRRIDSCLGELEQDRAGAVRGAYLDGESYADLAAQFDVPLNTMRTWLRRSLLSLRECLSR